MSEVVPHEAHVEDEPATSMPRRAVSPCWRDYLWIARPDHWFKNVFMVAGALLAWFCHAEALGYAEVLRLAVAVLAACLIASSNYVLNELLDAATDVHHPAKRARPVASGRVRRSAAIAVWLALAVLGLAVAAGINTPFLYAAIFLLVMGVLYNVPPIRTKDWPYVDVLSESVNNPVRLLLGWFAVSGHSMPPMSLVIAFWAIGAFFMATKRLAELRWLADPAVAATYRASFRYYSEEKLLLSMFFYTTTFALFLGVFIIRYHLELILIFPLVAGFICYYVRVALKKDSVAQSPELLYREKGLMLYLIVCVGAFFVLMFTDIPVLYTWFNVPASSVPALWTF